MADTRLLEVVNRTLTPIDYIYDGVPGTIPPAYRRRADGTLEPAGRHGELRTVTLPFPAAEMARRQNVKMGTEDRYDPRNVQYLLGIGDRADDGTLTPAKEWINNSLDPIDRGTATERFDRSTMGDLDATGRAVPASGFPRGRGSIGGNEPSNYQDGPVDTNRPD